MTSPADTTCKPDKLCSVQHDHDRNRQHGSLVEACEFNAAGAAKVNLFEDDICWSLLDDVVRCG